VQRTAKSFENSSFVTLFWSGFAAFTGPESFCQWFRGAKLTLDTSFERAKLPTGRSTDAKPPEAKAVGQEMASEKFAFSSSSTLWLLN
jgi:hypothetical protein